MRQLTKKEEQAMSLLATGMETAQIANCMGVSVRTVHAHFYNIYNKLGVKNRASALVKWLNSVQIA